MNMNKSLLFAVLLAAFSQTMPINWQGMPERHYKPGQPVPMLEELEPGITLPEAAASKPSQHLLGGDGTKMDPKSLPPKKSSQLLGGDGTKMNPNALPPKNNTFNTMRQTVRQGRRASSEAGAAVDQAYATIVDESISSKKNNSPLLGGDGKRPYQRTLTPKPSTAGDLGFRRYQDNRRSDDYVTAVNPDGSLKSGFHWEQEGSFTVAVRDGKNVVGKGSW